MPQRASLTPAGYETGYSTRPLTSPHNSSTISSCPSRAPRTKQYMRPSTLGSQSPGFALATIPPASFRMIHPAATSQTQQPACQYRSTVPSATAHTFSAAEPSDRILWTMAPPSSLQAASAANSCDLTRQLLPLRSLPHSTATSAFCSPVSAGGGCRSGRRVLRWMLPWQSSTCRWAPQPAMAL